MLRVLHVLIMIISTAYSFFNSKHFTPHRQNLRVKTSICMNYLDQLGNNSYVEKSTFLPRPVQPVQPVRPVQPIPLLTFDQMFLLIFNIEQIFMSSNTDRIIIGYGDKKGVYYLNSQKDKAKIEYLLSLIDVNVQIVNDYPTKMDQPQGELYCSPKHKPINNISDEKK